MAHYTPDLEYLEGKKMLEELKGKEGELIRYYVAQNEKHALEFRAKYDRLIDAFKVICEYVR